MALDEEASYALASWARFDATITDDLLGAVTSAFALIAVADGDLAKSEIDRFMLVLHDHANVLAPLNMDGVEQLFRDIAGAMFTDPEGGRQHALASIAAVEGNEVHCELVRSAAEIAVLADKRELTSERQVLRDICGALKIDPR